MKKVIISDVHNRRDKFFTLLEEVGAVKGGKKQEGFHLIQVGDLLSLGYDEQEREFYDEAFPLIDEALLGNHELPAIHPDPARVAFYGWFAVPGEWKMGRDIVAEQAVRDSFRAGRYKMATSVGDWLITHAGLTPKRQKLLGVQGKPAAEVAERLNEGFEKALSTEKGLLPIYDAIPHVRGGWTEGSLAGITWTHWTDLISGYRDVHLPQIVGHTHQQYPPNVWDKHRSRLIGIDTDRGVLALVTEDEGETFTTHYIP